MYYYSLSGNATVLFEFKKDADGVPDGMAIDANGNLWITLYKGAKVLIPISHAQFNVS